MKWMNIVLKYCEVKMTFFKKDKAFNIERTGSADWMILQSKGRSNKFRSIASIYNNPEECYETFLPKSGKLLYIRFIWF